MMRDAGGARRRVTCPVSVSVRSTSSLGPDHSARPSGDQAGRTPPPGRTSAGGPWEASRAA